MNGLKIFENPEFGTVRTVTINGEDWFVGIDVATALGYQNGSRDINRHVDNEDKIEIPFFDGNQTRNVIAINESGMYSMIFCSKLEKAKEFKHWVTAEILPSIRENGGYIKNQEQMTPEQIVANAA